MTSCKMASDVQIRNVNTVKIQIRTGRLSTCATNRLNDCQHLSARICNAKSHKKRETFPIFHIKIQTKKSYCKWKDKQECDLITYNQQSAHQSSSLRRLFSFYVSNSLFLSASFDSSSISHLYQTLATSFSRNPVALYLNLIWFWCWKNYMGLNI